MTTTTKDTIIAECCLDEGRPGKLMDTLTAARSRDPSVRNADVRDWLRRHGERLVGGGLTGGAYDVRKPETIIADAYEKSKAAQQSEGPAERAPAQTGAQQEGF